VVIVAPRSMSATKREPGRTSGNPARPIRTWTVGATLSRPARVLAVEDHHHWPSAQVSGRRKRATMRARMNLIFVEAREVFMVDSCIHGFFEREGL